MHRNLAANTRSLRRGFNARAQFARTLRPCRL